MNTSSRLRTAALTAALCLAVCGPVFAEVSGSGDEQVCRVLILGVIEGPDPIPGSFIDWIPVQDAGDAAVLNADGALRNDGRPDVSYRPQSGWPVVVWEYNFGSDHDIALAEWNGTGWTQPYFVSSTTIDDRDPRGFVDAAGAVWVVWWQDLAQPRIVFRKRNVASGMWSLERLVTDFGRRPSIVIVENAPVLAYERPGGAGSEIVLATANPDGSFSHEVIATTTRIERLDPVVHWAGGKLWVDWKHESGTFGWTVKGATGWSAVQTVDWDDTSWLGEETVRMQVRRGVLIP